MNFLIPAVAAMLLVTTAPAQSEIPRQRAEVFSISQIISQNSDPDHNLLYPSRIVASPDGQTIFVNGRNSHNAFRIQLGHGKPIVKQIIDSTGDGLHLLRHPTGLDTDAGGNAYLTGFGSDNAFRITPRNVVSQIIDAQGDGLGHPLDEPSRIAVDPQGRNVYVTGKRSRNAFHVKLAPDGTVAAIRQIIDGSGDGVHPLQAPNRIVVDFSSGNVFVAGEVSHNVFMIDPAGTITQIIGRGGNGARPMIAPFGLNVQQYGTNHGDVFVTGKLSNNAFRWSASTGQVSLIIDAGGDGQHPLQLPHDIWADSLGNAWLTGFGSSNVFFVSRNGAISEALDYAVAGVPGEVLFLPEGITVTDSPYTVFVSAFGSNNAYRLLFQSDSLQAKHTSTNR